MLGAVLQNGVLRDTDSKDTISNIQFLEIKWLSVITKWELTLIFLIHETYWNLNKETSVLVIILGWLVNRREHSGIEGVNPVKLKTLWRLQCKNYSKETSCPNTVVLTNAYMWKIWELGFCYYISTDTVEILTFFLASYWLRYIVKLSLLHEGCSRI